MIHLFLADLDPSEKELGIWLACAFAVLKILEAGKNTFGKSKVVVDQQPLGIKIEEHFVNRREFDEFRVQHSRDMAKLEAMQEKTLERIERTTIRLSEEIVNMGKGAYEGRQKLWTKVNDQGERLKSVEDRIPLIKATPHDV